MALPPAISAILHFRVAQEVKRLGPVKSLLDNGGTGRMAPFGPWARIRTTNLAGKGVDRIDGCALPFGDAAFDAVVSVAVVEHVHTQAAFLAESLRVSRLGAVHWYPAGGAARAVEALKKEIGHPHPCVIPEVPAGAVPFGTIGEHLLLLATLYPKLNTRRLLQYVVDHGSDTYGYIVVQRR